MKRRFEKDLLTKIIYTLDLHFLQCSLFFKSTLKNNRILSLGYPIPPNQWGQEKHKQGNHITVKNWKQFPVLKYCRAVRNFWLLFTSTTQNICAFYVPSFSPAIKENLFPKSKYYEIKPLGIFVVHQ